ncbi:hypothetical protein PHMEG_00013913 [Phytophthora megakarya]|uniref:Uncharacterized protein n=1 Tax=Phytophthora megakarya TaxID=4795 RepID=A0A225W654_9STRA|nr:hypothetical protein PHMEG_00013913 [Phytophthora megakarya]
MSSGANMQNFAADKTNATQSVAESIEDILDALKLLATYGTEYFSNILGDLVDTMVRFISLPPEYLDDIRRFIRGLKRIEADNDQNVTGRKSGKSPLSFSLYQMLCQKTIGLLDSPRHIYTNPLNPNICCVLALVINFVSNSTLISGMLFPGCNEKSRFSEKLGVLLKNETGDKAFGTHSIRKGVATFATSGNTGGPSLASVGLRCG